MSGPLGVGLRGISGRVLWVGVVSSLVVSGLRWCVVVGRGFRLRQVGGHQVVKEFRQAGSVVEVQGDAVVG